MPRKYRTRIHVLLVCCLVPFAFASLAPCSTIQLPWTGQDKCYDLGGAEIACARTGQDGERQFGVSWPEPRFVVTHCDSAGPCADQSADCDVDTSNDVITDRLTGLIWVRTGNLSGTLLWPNAVDFPKSVTVCGYTDWRLPNVNEIESLHNAAADDQSQWLSLQGFVNIVQGRYWSSTTHLISDFERMMSNMRFGTLELGFSSDKGSVLPVRSHTAPPAQIWKTGQSTIVSTGDDGDYQEGISWPSPRFTVIYCNGTGLCEDQTLDCDGDGANDMVEDNLTGLTWARNANPANRYTDWRQSMNYAKNLTLCGYSDWRLSNRKELLSLASHPHLPRAGLPDGFPFTNFPPDIDPLYWTSTARGDGAYVVSIPGGGIHFDSRTSGAWGYMWPVRGGNPASPRLGLSVSPMKKNGGSGTITSSDGNITCPGFCRWNYHKSASVTLTAVASAGSTFIEWEPRSLGCLGGSCTVTMDRAKTVKVVFVGDYTLTTASLLRRKGTGMVTVTPPGTDCADVCRQTYPLSSPVTIVANPGPQSYFRGWLGCPEAAGNTCTALMNRNRTIKAVFYGAGLGALQDSGLIDH